MMDKKMEDRCFGEELVKNMGDVERQVRLVGNGVEHYSNKISMALHPMPSLDLPFIYAGLLIMLKTIEKIDPDAKELGEEFFDATKKNMNSFVFKEKAKKNMD